MLDFAVAEEHLAFAQAGFCFVSFFYEPIFWSCSTGRVAQTACMWGWDHVSETISEQRNAQDPALRTCSLHRLRGTKGGTPDDGEIALLAETSS